MSLHPDVEEALRYQRHLEPQTRCPRCYGDGAIGYLGLRRITCDFCKSDGVVTQREACEYLYNRAWMAHT